MFRLFISSINLAMLAKEDVGNNPISTVGQSPIAPTWSLDATASVSSPGFSRLRSPAFRSDRILQPLEYQRFYRLKPGLHTPEAIPIAFQQRSLVVSKHAGAVECSNETVSEKAAIYPLPACGYARCGDHMNQKQKSVTAIDAADPVLRFRSAGWRKLRRGWPMGNTTRGSERLKTGQTNDAEWDRIRLTCDGSKWEVALLGPARRSWEQVYRWRSKIIGIA
jgi:hypothetical protein